MLFIVVAVHWYWQLTRPRGQREVTVAGDLNLRCWTKTLAVLYTLWDVCVLFDSRHNTGCLFCNGLFCFPELNIWKMADILHLFLQQFPPSCGFLLSFGPFTLVGSNINLSHTHWSAEEEARTIYLKLDQKNIKNIALLLEAKQFMDCQIVIIDRWSFNILFVTPLTWPCFDISFWQHQQEIVHNEMHLWLYSIIHLTFTILPLPFPKYK